MAGGPPQTTSPPNGTAARRPWRGAAPPEAPRHRWQQEGAEAAATHSAWRRRRRLVVAGLFGGSGVLLAMLVWSLLYAPVQTPLVAVAATGYDWPLPPNAWASEDVAALQPLDRETIALVDLSKEWRTADRGLAKLDEELKRIGRRHAHSPVAIIYLSMYGVIDGAGRPCLIPPGANPQVTGTWLPLADVFERIKIAGWPDSQHKLMVLDCSREVVNWHVGKLGGGFAEALPAALEEAKIPNLAILNSASGGEKALASPALKASLFGHYFGLGLAGAADGDDDGNGNGRVSLQELQRYLARHVGAWAKHLAGQPQTPSVFPATADFDVAWTLRTSAWRELVNHGQRIERAEPSIGADRLTRLWRQLDELRSARPWRFDPIAWRDLEHRLLKLEQLAVSGESYEEPASALAGQLSGALEQATRRYSDARRRGSWPAYAAILSGEAQAPAATLHSLPLSAYWGTVDPDVLHSLAGQVQQIADDPSGDHVAAGLAAAREAALPAALDEVNFLAIWQRQHVPALWRDGKPLSSALHLRQLAETNAVPPSAGNLPGDERAHAWVRTQFAEIDHARRELEDAVALGPTPGSATPTAEDAIAALERITIDEQAVAAYALRDELWAQLPYLAAWLCRPQYNAERQQQADLATRQTLIPLVAAGLKLEQELHRADLTAGGAPRVWTADAAVTTIREKWESLQAQFQSALSQLAALPDSPESLYEIEAILGVPSIPWDTRQQLARERMSLQVKLAARASDRSSASREPAAEAPAAATQLARVARWPAHPLVMLLQSGAEAGNELQGNSTPEQLAHTGRLGEQVRRALGRRASSEAAPGDRPARFAAEKAPVAALATLSQNESRVRSAAALWFPRPGVDPIGELRRADLQELLLWRARRAVDDFYGPARAGSEPFFAISAGNYLAAARALGPMCEAMTAEAAELDGLLARRRIAARDALAVQATDLLLVDQAASVTSSLAVTPRTPEALPDLPHATAAVFLADDSGRIGPASTPLQLPPAGAAGDQPLLREETNLDSASLKNRGPILQAVASVRGNDFVAPVLLRAPGGVQVEYRPPAYGPPQVTVLGYDRKRASIVFILDCSHSMQTPATVEAPGAQARTQATRMEVAKGALRALLGDMAEQGAVRVGVRLFGHRVGWSTTEADKLLRQTAYGDDIPAALRPYADVENILPLGRFDSLAAGRVYDKLQTVRPWGESPLYLALQQAVGDFGPDDNAARSIVVVTDGQNYQFNPPQEFQPALADVLSAAERARISIHIVGFDLPQNEAQAAGREFSEIASRTGGSYAPASGATALLNSLQRLLQPGEFQVSSGGSPVGEAPLGQPVVLRGQRGRQRYDVQFENRREPVELAGGEAVELAIRRGEPRLEVVPYTKGSPRFEPLLTSGDNAPTGLQAGIHRSIRTPDGVQFPISIQHEEGRFVPRPVELWVEVAPVGLPPESSPGPYIFYDAPFEPQTTVPLVTLLARNWPAEAAKAEVRVWAKNTATPVAEERPLAEVADRLPEGAGGFAIPGVSGVTYQVRTAGGNGEALAVGLIERHERPETVGSLKVTLAPAATLATHQFDRQNRIVLHTFRFEQPASDLRSRLSVQFTARASAQQHAWQVSQPVFVDVADRSDLLELTPPTAR